MSNAWVWLTALVGLPALVVGVSFLRVDVDRLRRLAVLLTLFALGYFASSFAFRSGAEPLSPFIFTLF